MTKTITVVCDTDEGVIYGSIEEARKAYFSEVDEINEASHKYACEHIEDDYYFEELVSAIVAGDRNMFNAIKTNYYEHVSNYNEDGFNDWLNDCCIVSDIEVEV